MSKKNVIKLFNDYKIRAKWDSEEEDHYYAIVDVITILTKSKNPKSYWSTLKGRIKKELIDGVTICDQMKLPDKKGIMRLNDVANTKQLLRIIQSIPSPNAEPFKQWLAQVGYERLYEINDPQMAIERAISTYRKKGYSEEWITQRLKIIESKKDLTAKWNRAEVQEGLEYAILINEVIKAWSECQQNSIKIIKN